jgi:hypothetical protein
MRTVLPALAASTALLLLAAAAAAQQPDGGGLGVAPKDPFGPPPVQALGSHWTNPELWDGYADPARPVGNELPALPSNLQTKMSQQVADGLKVTVPQMRLACATDQQKLCADKKSNLSADRCLEYYRLKLSSPCKQAWEKVTLAAEGRL